MIRSLPLFLLLSLAAAPLAGRSFASTALPQVAVDTTGVPGARETTIARIEVRGTDDERLANFVRRVSGLRVGQRIVLPGDPLLADALRALLRLDTFRDVRILAGAPTDGGVPIIIDLEMGSVLTGVDLRGVPEDLREAVTAAVPLERGRVLRPGDPDRLALAAEQALAEEGYALADVTVTTESDTAGVRLRVDAEPGPRIVVGEVRITGNEALSDAALRRQLEATQTSRWWGLRPATTFDRTAFEGDLDRLLDFYRAQGYYDAYVVRDTAYIDTTTRPPQTVVEIEVHEGPIYRYGDISWSGNTIVPDDAIHGALALAPGDRYDQATLDANLYGNAAGTDVASLYLDRGYLRFQAEPTLRVVRDTAAALLDLHLDITEGEVYTVSRVTIEGNTFTDEDVLRRELLVAPGDPFRRAALRATAARLQQLGFLTDASVTAGPELTIDDATRTVALTYRLEDRLNRRPVSFGGTVGAAGLVFQAGLNLTNFAASKLGDLSAWRPIPQGDGQQLSLGVQTGGPDYQRFSLAFTEPWFRDRPHPTGFTVDHSRYQGRFVDDDDGRLTATAAAVFFEHRLPRRTRAWSLVHRLRFQQYDNDAASPILPAGVSQELIVGHTLTRERLDRAVFTRRGTSLEATLDVAPPLDGFEAYVKGRVRAAGHLPLPARFSVAASVEGGAIGAFPGRPVRFERFVVGGSPFDVQGTGRFFGRDAVYLRGYPAEVIGPRSETGDPLGGRVLARTSAEVRWHAVARPQLSVMPYLFADAANTWRSVEAVEADLFRAVGVGLRLRLPVLGVVDLGLGYNLDRYEPLGDRDGARGWSLQFSLGRTLWR